MFFVFFILLFGMVLILPDVLCVIRGLLRVLLCVCYVLAAHPVMDVDMVFSPQVGRGYHSASMVDIKEICQRKIINGLFAYFI
jgi:hypothetical protein